MNLDRRGLTLRFAAAVLLGVLASAVLASVGQSAPPGLAISPTKLTFASVAVGSQSAPQNVGVSNPTQAPVQLTEIIVSGIDFAGTNDCGKELAAGARCAIQVVFKPAIPGDRMGSLEILASDKNVPFFVPLDGTGE